MRLFTQSLSREVKKWFRALVDGSIINSQQFEEMFLRKWEEKKNPVQLLMQYNQLWSSNDEAIKNFSDRFNKIYNSLPAHCKPLEVMAKLHYAEGFKDDFALLLRERRSTTLEYKMNDAIEVEINMMASNKGKYKTEVRKVKEEKQPSTSQNSIDAKFDSMMKVMEKLVEKISVEDRHVGREKMNLKSEIPISGSLGSKVHHLRFCREVKGIIMIRWDALSKRID